MTNSLIRLEELPLADPGVALTAADAERIATAIEAELAPATRVAYDCGWRQWDRWCQDRGLDPLPARPDALAAFLAERAESGLTFGTLDGWLCGVCGAACDASWASHRRRQAHPLTVQELGQIVESIDATTVTGKRDRAILLLGYASAMRPSEVSALDTFDIVRKPTGALCSISADPRPTRTPMVSSSASRAGRTLSPTRSGRSTSGWQSARASRAHCSRGCSTGTTRRLSASVPERSAEPSRSAPSPPASTAFW